MKVMDEKKIDKKIAQGIFPEVVYKYRCWNDEPNDDILKKGIIYLSSPSELQADYPEARLPIDEAQLTEENLMNYARHHAKTYFPQLTGIESELKARELRSKMKIEDPSHRQEAEEFAKKRNDETLGIFCCSLSFNNISMWEGMSCLGTGFAIGLDLKAILLDDRISGAVGLVNYYTTGSPPKVSPFSYSQEDRVDKSMKEIYNIPEIYSYEREIRIVRTNRVMKKGIVQPYQKRNRLIKLNQNQVSEVILGDSSNEANKLEMLECARRNFPGAKFYSTTFKKGEVLRLEIK